MKLKTDVLRASMMGAALGLVLSVLVGCATTTPSGGWWTFQSDAERSGYVMGGMGSSPSLLWDASLVGGTISLTPPVFGAVVVGSGPVRVFIGSGYGDGKLYALLPHTGAVQWTFAAATNSGFFGAPAAANGRVYAATLGMNPYVYALDQATGALVWQTPLPGVGSRASVAVGGGRVFVNTDQHKLYALNQMTGALLWSVTTTLGTASQESSPAVALNKVYVGSDTELFAFDVTNGALVWKYLMTGIVGFSSTVIDTTTTPALVLIGTNDKKVHAVNAATGAGVWVHNATATLAFSSVAVAQGKVFVFDYVSVVALDVTTGGLLWTQTMPTIPRHSPAIAGRVLFYSDDTTVFGLDTGTGAPVWNAPIPGNGNPNSPGAELAIELEILLVPNKGHVHAFS